MKFCQKCWSDKLVHTPGLTICKGCGHSKKELNVVVNNDVDGGLYGKRMQSFVTEKSNNKNRIIEQTGQQDSSWKQHIFTYQKSLKQAAESFISHFNLDNRTGSLILANLKAIWMKYLHTWKQLNKPLHSIFTNNNKIDQEQQQIESNYENLMKIESEKQQQQQSLKRRRKSTFLSVDLDVQDTPTIKQEHDVQKMSKHQLKSYICQLSNSMSSNTRNYFKKLLDISNFQKSMVDLATRQYVLRLYFLENRKDLTSKQQLTFMKYKKLQVKMSWLKQMVQSRNQNRFQNMTQRNLSIYIYLFDMLSYRLSLKAQKNRSLSDIISKYLQNSRYNNTVINIFLSKLRLVDSYHNLFTTQNQQMTSIPPLLNFNLLYSFIHVALLKSKQVFYLHQILEHTVIKNQNWLQTQYLRINNTPSIQILRNNTLKLIQELSINFTQSNRCQWIDRISQQIGIANFAQPIKVLTKTLISKPDYIVNEDIQCLASIIIFIKLHVSMDEQANVVLVPFQKIISSKLLIEQNEIYNKIKEYVQLISKIPQQIEERNINVTSILRLLSQSNDKSVNKHKFENIEDLKYLTTKKIKQLKQQDALTLQKQSSGYQKYKQIFTNFPLQLLPPQPSYILTTSQSTLLSQYQFKPFLINQIPSPTSLISFDKDDIILPSNNYQIIRQFRSNYYPLQKFEFLEILGRLSENKCSIDELYRKIEQFEKHLLIFED